MLSGAVWQLSLPLVTLYTSQQLGSALAYLALMCVTPNYFNRSNSARYDTSPLYSSVLIAAMFVCVGGWVGGVLPFLPGLPD